MINIISRQANLTAMSGPYKVYANLVKGLERIGYPFVVNRDFDATRRLWIHDDIDALRYLGRSKAMKVLGPNLFVMPDELPPGIEYRDALYLHPCDWAVEFWERAGFEACPLAAWPVGIDTEEFEPSSVPKSKRKVLVYHKMRDPQELFVITETLHRFGLPYSFVFYGDYTETEYKSLLAETSFILWHGRPESQGIALQEAMSCNIPILVCDATSVAQTRGGYPFEPSTYTYPVSVAPYFDETCGIILQDLSEIAHGVEMMLAQLDSYQPREFVIKNLSLEGQAKAFVALWEKWGMTYEDGLGEQLLNQRYWKGPPLLPKLVRRGLEKSKLAAIDSFERLVPLR